MTKDQKLIVEIIESLANESLDDWLKVSDIENKVTFCGQSWLYKHLNNLVQINVLDRKQEHIEGVKKKVYMYRLKNSDCVIGVLSLTQTAIYLLPYFSIIGENSELSLLVMYCGEDQVPE